MKLFNRLGKLAVVALALGSSLAMAREVSADRYIDGHILVGRFGYERVNDVMKPKFDYPCKLKVKIPVYDYLANPVTPGNVIHEAPALVPFKCQTSFWDGKPASVSVNALLVYGLSFNFDQNTEPRKTLSASFRSTMGCQKAISRCFRRGILI